MSGKQRIHRPIEPCVDYELRREWALRHEHCQVCGIHYELAAHRRFPGALQTHHIIGGGRRYDYEWNFLRLCSLCHEHLHSGGCSSDDGERLPPLTLAHIIWCQRAASNYRDGRNTRKLSKLLGKRIPEPELPPPEFMRMRARYGYYPEETKHGTE